MQSSAPKFGSFKPRAKPIPSNETQSKRNDRDDRQEVERRRDQKHESIPRSHEHPKITSDSLQAQQKGYGKPIADVSNDLYVIDVKGDQDSLRYGSIKSSSVPQYRAPSVFRVLGQNRDERYSSSSGRSLLSSLGRTERKRLAADGKFYRPNIDYDERSGSFDREVQEADFLPLDKTKKRKRKSPPTQPSQEAPTVLQVESVEEQDSDFTGRSSRNSDTDGDAEQEVSHLKEENARLSKQVKLEPQNVSAWLEYISFQSQWLTHERAITYEPFSIEDTRSIAEVKLSVYKKALKAVGKDLQSKETLLLGMMREAEKVYESSVLSDHWNEVAHANNDCLQLWIEYVKFAQTTFVGFHFESCKNLYQDFLKNLSEKSRKTSSDTQQVESLQIDVLLRLACFMRDCGYNELSTALWQALFEINCFRPLSLSDTRGDTAISTEFGDFWDSECPRIGEEGARGWRNMDGAEPVRSLEPFQEPSETQQHGGRFSTWANEEHRQSHKTTIPGRATINEEEDEDPFRVVLFSDLQPFLSIFRTKTSRLELINAFLCFHRMPTVRGNLNNELSNHWCYDPVIVSQIPEFKKNQKSQAQAEFVNFSPNCFPKYQTTAETLFSNTNNSLSSLESLRDARVLSRTLELLTSVDPDDENLAEYYLAFLAHTDISKARKKAKSFLKLRPSSLRLYNAYALIEEKLGNQDTSSHVFLTAIKMTSSSRDLIPAENVLLRRNWVWSSLRSSSDREKTLRRLVMSSSDSPADTNHNESLVLTESDIMQTDTTLRRDLDEILSRFTKDPASNLWRTIPYYAELLVLLTYLTTDLSNTLTSYEHQLSYISAVLQSASNFHTSAVVEHLHQLRAELINYHTHKYSSFSPTEIRSSLQASVSFFPENSILLSAQLQNEALFKFDDRVRSVVRETISGTGMSNQETLQAHVFLIALELRRYYRSEVDDPPLADTTAVILNELHSTMPPLTTPHAIRAVFELALANQLTYAGKKGIATNSAPLWRMYLMFEMEQYLRAFDTFARRKPPKSKDKQVYGQQKSQDVDDGLTKQKERVRNVYFRGLRALPWHKGFAMLAFQYLTDAYADSLERSGSVPGPKREGVLTDNELQAIYDGMSARGIRLLVEIH